MGDDAKEGAPVAPAYDVFLSHASEDKAAFVEPLYQALTKRGLRVWYDRTHIQWGDIFRHKMEEGLQRSRFGIVVLSPRFPKYWPQQEMSVLHTLETALGARILPIILDMTFEQVRVQFPFMAIRHALMASLGPDALAEQARALVLADKGPTPTYLNVDDQALDVRLEALYEKKAAMEATGGDTSVVIDDILTLRRKQRDGPELRAGYRMNGRYKLLEPCGRGGFATVWAAYDVQARRQVALKILHGQFASSHERIERFFRGSRFMQRLKHPHIVEIFSDKEHDDSGRPYFVMELLGGGDLWKTIQKKSLRPETLLDHVEVIAEALAHAHAQGIIHRDVKPANILLTRDGQPKLTDFDLVAAGDTTAGHGPARWGHLSTRRRRPSKTRKKQGRLPTCTGSR